MSENADTPPQRVRGLRALKNWFLLTNVSPEVDPIRTLSVGVVAISTAILSYDTLRHFALAMGSSEFASYLFPLAFDAAVLGATRAWLHPNLSQPTRDYARRFAIFTIAASIVGNSIQHWRQAARRHIEEVARLVKDGFTEEAANQVAGDFRWWAGVVIVFSALIPFVLALAIHLAALVSGDARKRKKGGATKAIAQSRVAAEASTLAATGTDDAVAAVIPLGEGTDKKDAIRRVLAQLRAEGRTFGPGGEVSYVEIDRLAGTNGYAKRCVPKILAEESRSEGADDGER